MSGIQSHADFIKLLFEYEYDESKFSEIKEKLDSGHRKRYLYRVDEWGTNSIITSLRYALKIRNYLVQKIERNDEVDIEELIVTAIRYDDYENTKFLCDNFSRSINLANEDHNSIFLLAFQSEDIRIVKFFIDMYEKYNIFSLWWDTDESIYERIYTKLPEHCRKTVIKLLLKNEYYGPIILQQTICNFRVMTGILSDLVIEKKVDTRAVKKYKNSYDIAKNIEYFRENCLPQISTVLPEIILHPDSMEALRARYRNIFLQKFGAGNIHSLNIEEKTEYYNIISGDTKFCDYYSILSIDDLDKLFV